MFLKGFGKVIYFVFFEGFWVNGCCCLVGVEIFWEKFLKLEGNKGLKFIFNKNIGKKIMKKYFSFKWN